MPDTIKIPTPDEVFGNSNIPSPDEVFGVKKKDNSQSIGESSQISGIGNSSPSETSSVSESQLPLQDQPNPPEPPPPPAKTIGEYALGAVGVVDKGFANMFDKLDWVQTNAGDAVNQILLGKDFMQQTKSLRDNGIAMPTDVVSVRPFKAAADALRWSSDATKELPNTVVGNVTKGVAGIIPEITATMLLPEMKTAQIISNLGIKSASKFGVVLGTEKAVEGAEKAQTPVEQWTAPSVGFFEGYTTGMLFDGLGEASSKIGESIATKLIPNPTSLAQMGSKVVTQTSASTLTNALTFGGYGSAQEYLETGKVTGNTFLSNFGMGVALGVKDVGKALYAKGLNSFIATPTEKVKTISKSDITPEQLSDASKEHLNKIENDVSTDKETELGAAALNQNTATLKAVTDEIKSNPDGFNQSIEESSLDPKLKEVIIDKANEVSSENNPQTQEAKPFSDQIKKIDKKIASIKKNKTLSSSEVELQTTELNTQKEILVNRVRDIYDPNSFKEGDIIQSQNTEKGRSVKGGVEKTADGVLVKDDLMGDVEFTTSKDVLVKKEETRIELKETDEELKARGAVDKESPYQLASETFQTKEEFIAGVKRMAAGGMDMQIVNSSDTKTGDVPLMEVVKIITENSPPQTHEVIRTDAKATSEEELLSRQEMFKRRLERLDVADNVLSGKMKKPKIEPNKPLEPKMGETTPQGEKMPTIEDKPSTIEKQQDRSLAALRSQDKVLSLDPQIEDLKLKLAEAKNEPKRMQEMIKNFLKENKESIAEAQIKASDITALVRANTWDKVGKAIKNMTTRLKENTPRYRADNLLNLLGVKKDIREQIKKEAVDAGLTPKSKEYVKYVKEQFNKRNPFQDIPETVYQNMVKKATEAPLSDTKLRIAEEYIDKALTDAAFVKHEVERMGYVEKIEKLTAPKAVLDKGSRGGSSPKVKKAFATYSGGTSFIEAVETIHDLITKGTSKRYKDPAKKALENQDKIEELNEKIDDLGDPKKNEGIDADELLSRKEAIEAEQELLIEENALLEYAGVRDMEIGRLKEKLADVEKLREDQKTTSQIERAARKVLYSDLANKLITEDIKPKLFNVNKKTGRVSPVGGEPRRVFSTLFLRNTNFWSLNDIITFKSNFRPEDPLPAFNNRLNDHYAPIVTDAQNLQAKRELDFRHEWVTRLAEIYPATGVRKLLPTEFQGRLDRIVIDLQDGKEIVTKLKHDKGEQEIELTPAQSIQKMLQWRSADGRRSMEKVGAKEYQMGYTQEAVTALEQQLKPQEVKLMNFLVEMMDKYSDIYDKAYIKENGISMKVVEDFYWPLTKYKETPMKEDLGGIHINPQVRKDRTIRRTKSSTPLKHGSAIEDVLSYANEAIRYEAWATPLREMQYIYKDPHVRRAVATEYGTDAVRQMDDNIKAFIGTLPKDSYAILDWATGAYATSVLGLKIIPVINQMAGSVYLLTKMPPLEFAKAVAGVLPGKRYSEVKTALRKYLGSDIFVQERSATSRTAYGEEQSSLITRVSKSDASPTWEKVKSYFPSREIKEGSGSLLREGDLAPIVGMGAGYFQYRYKTYSGKELTTDVINKGEADPHMKRALRDWRLFMEWTQQSLRTSNRSAISKSSSMGRSIAVFTSGQAGIQRFASSLAREAARSYRLGDMEGMKKAIGGIAVAHVLGGATFGLINGLTLPDTDKKKVLKSTLVGAALGNIDGLFLLGRGVQMVKSYLSDNPWGKDFKIQLMPIIRNVENIWKYGTEVAELASAEVVDEQSLFDAELRFATSISMFSGLPVDGTMRISNAVGRTIQQVQQDIDDGEGIPKIVVGGAKELVSNKYKDPAFRPDVDIRIDKFTNFKDALDAAKSYMVFNEGGFVRFKDRFREPDKEGTFSISLDGLNEFAYRAALSGQSPTNVINAAFADKYKERLGRKFEYKKGLNTVEEIKSLLEQEGVNMTASDQKMLIELFKEWSKFNVEKETIDGQKAALEIYKKGLKITEKDINEVLNEQK